MTPPATTPGSTLSTPAPSQTTTYTATSATNTLHPAAAVEGFPRTGRGPAPTCNNATSSSSNPPRREDNLRVQEQIGQYTGDFHGVCWNAQGYFMSRTATHARKRWAAARLMRSRDFLMLSETHATTGGIQAYNDIPGTSSW